MGRIKINALTILLFVTSLSLQNCYNERIYKMPDYTISFDSGKKLFFRMKKTLFHRVLQLV